MSLKSKFRMIFLIYNNLIFVLRSTKKYTYPYHHHVILTHFHYTFSYIYIDFLLYSGKSSFIVDIGIKKQYYLCVYMYSDFTVTHKYYIFFAIHLQIIKNIEYFSYIL